MPQDGSDPTPGDCAVKKARYIKAGELLLRNLNSGLCSHTAWMSELTSLTYQGHEVSAPSTLESNEVFACDADGKPVKKMQAAIDATQ